MDSTPINALVIEARVVEVLCTRVHTCSDPEMPVHIYEVGLIYNVNTHRMFADVTKKGFQASTQSSIGGESWQGL